MSCQFLESIRGAESFVLPGITTFRAIALGVFNEEANSLSDAASDLGERPKQPAPALDLDCSAALCVGRGDPFLIDLREVKEQERALKPLFARQNGTRETLL